MLNRFAFPRYCLHVFDQTQNFLKIFIDFCVGPEPKECGAPCLHKRSDVLIEMQAPARENEENLEEHFLLVSADVVMLCRANCITWKTFLRFSRSNVSDVHVAAAYILLLSDRL